VPDAGIALDSGVATYQNITDPEQLAVIDQWSRRMIWFGIAAYLVGFGLWFFAPSGLIARIVMLVTALCVYFILLLLVMTPRKLRRLAKEMGWRRGVRPVLPYPLSVRVQVATSVIGFAPMVVVMGLQLPGMFGFTIVLAMPVFLIGVTLVKSSRLREPGPPSCPKCAYPVDPPEFPAMCSECAAPMPTLDAATLMPRVYRPWFLWSGVGLIVASVALFYGVMFKPPALVGVLPRPARLALAARDHKTFETFDLTKLSPAERDRLTGRILSVRDSDEIAYLHPQLTWIGGRLLADELDADQVERFIVGTAELGVLTRSRDDGRTEILIHAETPEQSWRTVQTTYFFGGFEFDPVPEGYSILGAIARSESGLDWRSLGYTFDERDRHEVKYPALATANDAPILTPIIREPTRVRARVVFVAVPAKTSPAPTIAWHDDGTWTVTPQPLAAFELTAERMIEPEP